jgi:hypothetical protein
MSWTEEIESDEKDVQSFKRFKEFVDRSMIIEVMGAERRKILDDYIAVTWIPNKIKLQRHHRMAVRSMEKNTMSAAEHGHSSNNKCEDSIKLLHGIYKTALTLAKNSIKWKEEKRQEEADAAESHTIWAIIVTVDAVTMFAEGLNMRQVSCSRLPTSTVSPLSFIVTLWAKKWTSQPLSQSCATDRREC